MYRELASSTSPLSAQELADALGLHANTVRLHLERLREAGLVESEADPPGHRRASPAPLLPRPRRARARLRPARPRAAGRPARRDGRAPGCQSRRRRRHRLRVGYRGRSAHPVQQLRQRAGGRAGAPRIRARGRRLAAPSGSAEPSPSASISSTAPSASSPRPIPSWSATCTVACARASSTRSAGEASRRSRRCTTRSRATSTVAVGYPDQD